MTPLAPLMAAAALCAAALLPWALNRWRFRHIPGPFSLPILGDLPAIYRLGGLHEFTWRCRQKYGKIFKIYLGNQMQIIVCDPDIAKRLTLRNNNRSLGRQLRIEGEDDMAADQGLVGARGERWRLLRLAWQPTFNSSSLEGYSQLMDDCAEKLARRLLTEGESGREVEMWRALGRMTLAVVGSTAYGVNFHTLPDEAVSKDEAAEGVQLQDACATMFSASGLNHGSLWLFVNVVVPLPRVVGWLARRLPDKRLLDLLQARDIIRQRSRSLMADWRAAHPLAGGAAAAATSSAAPAGPPPGEQPLVESIPATVPLQPAAADPPSPSASESSSGGSVDALAHVRRPTGKGVLPGSFLALMLAARDGASGHGLSDSTIVAQSNTFLLAGYETTANTLAFCVAAIASHPRVQARLLAEVDAYGRDAPVTYARLGELPYTEAVVREALRLFPPATLVSREVRDTGYALTPGGPPLPAGTSVLSCMYSYQRDPEYWPAAAEFRPERWLPEGAALTPTTPDAWTPFGSGARMCIGFRFALQEAKIALVRLYQHATYELLPGQVPLALEQNLTLSPKHGVRVRVVARA